MDKKQQSEIYRALAKAISFRGAGNSHNAELWGLRLVQLLQISGILATKIRKPQPKVVKKGEEKDD